MIDVCRLHRGAPVPLRNSHIMPSWAFKRASGDAGQHVLLTNSAASLSNYQFREHLLCADCEQRIGVLERYASTIVRQADGTFPARALARELPMGDPRLLCGDVLDSTSIVKFASSVFWRASVSTRFPDLVLGDDSDEAFRRFLPGEAAFPDSARLIVTLIDCPGAPVDQVVLAPAGRRADAYHRAYAFALFGMAFTLAVGQPPLSMDLLCFVRTSLVTVTAGEAELELIARVTGQSEVRGALRGRQDGRT